MRYSAGATKRRIVGREGGVAVRVEPRVCAAQTSHVCARSDDFNNKSPAIIISLITTESKKWPPGELDTGSVQADGNQTKGETTLDSTLRNIGLLFFIKYLPAHVVDSSQPAPLTAASVTHVATVEDDDTAQKSDRAAKKNYQEPISQTESGSYVLSKASYRPIIPTLGETATSSRSTRRTCVQTPSYPHSILS